ncbi:PEP/pyruvate-binding domain-containing protein [Spirillospora sp. CA-255316]
MTQRTFVLPLDDAGAGPAAVGGKGAMLARLATAGLPVPEGFHLTTEAYRFFVDFHELREPILSVAARVDPDLPVTAEAAARRIADLFMPYEPLMEIAAQVRWAYAGLGEQDHPVAVRSSAPPGTVPEESSPADLYETVLWVRGEAALVTAIRRCWASLWSARALEYRIRNGIDHDEAAMAVLVQSMVRADAAGMMTTVAPGSPAAESTGGRRSGTGRILVNAAWGLSEPVITGRVTPDVYVVEKGSGHVVERRIAEKTTMTVASDRPDGPPAAEEPVPKRWRHEPVLNADQAAALARLGERTEALFGRPVSVEWALHDGYPYILLARPLTGRAGRDAAGAAGAAAGESGTEAWNDSLAGDHLWSSGDLAEAVPDVMTPCTWSLVQMFMHETLAVPELGGHRAYGNIGGRLYMNLSVAAALVSASMGRGSRESLLEEAFGRLPPEAEIPRLPMSRAEIARHALPRAAKAVRRARAGRRRLPGFLESSPRRCEELRGRIGRESDPAGLLRLWGHELEPFFVESCHMLAAARREGAPSAVALRRDLDRLVGEADADAMLSGLRKPDGPVPAALGPLEGLARLDRGDLDEPGYLREWGHRGPHEFEISMPRPAEDPSWLEEQLAAGSGREAAERLRARREQSRAAWRRFRDRHPQEVAATRRRVGRWARAAHDRESALSEVLRIYAVVRAFLRRAGELTGRGDDLFFLTIDEVLAVLDGEAGPLDRVARRRLTYERYRALAPYPVLIRGRFDPVAWAGSRGRRTDFHDATEPLAGFPPEPAAGAATSGMPGAAGVVEGTVRVLDGPEKAAALAPGEVLVTGVADSGWTLVLPRAGAVVTDVGAPLSRAAAAARELAVPAVLGCGNATMRLRTGDRVRVDGERGTVEFLSGAGRAGRRERLLTTEG